MRTVKITILKGNMKGGGPVFDDKSKITIGRGEDNDVVLDSTYGDVSEKHAEIIYKRNKYYIRDLCSENGTFIDDEKIQPNQDVEIKSGDEFKLGNTKLKFIKDISYEERESYYKRRVKSRP